MTKRQLSGYKAIVNSAITLCRDGAYVRLDLKTAHKLVEIIDELQGIKK